MSHIARCALPIFVLLAGPPTAAYADALVCHAIRRGESAPQAARRITGDSRDAYQSWFQIRNASARFVPKSQYNRIRAGWQACLLKPLVQRASAQVDGAIVPEALEASAAVAAVRAESLATSADAIESAGAVARDAGEARLNPQSIAFETMRAIRGVDFPIVWLGAAMVVPLVGWRFLDDHLVRRKTRTLVMRHFATRFVKEFERPLKLLDAERPVRSRVRYSARRGRLDILLAPGKGRRYPNLSDHKKNVEYDVARITRALADQSFVNGRLYMQAGWVVVPFQFLVRRSRGEGGKNEPGVTCISSF